MRSLHSSPSLRRRMSFVACPLPGAATDGGAWRRHRDVGGHHDGGARETHVSSDTRMVPRWEADINDGSRRWAEKQAFASRRQPSKILLNNTTLWTKVMEEAGNITLLEPLHFSRQRLSIPFDAPFNVAKGAPYIAAVYCHFHAKAREDTGSRAPSRHFFNPRGSTFLRRKSARVVILRERCDDVAGARPEHKFQVDQALGSQSP